jgi:uncharacterized protein (DUF362 family)
MNSPVVTLTRCDDYTSDKIALAVARQFELLGGVEKFISPGDSVLLKPNLIAPKSAGHAAQTHPEVILAVAKLIKDYGGKVSVGDSPAWSNVFDCVKKLKLDKPLMKLGVPVIQLDKPKWIKIGAKGTKVGISSVAMNADKIINLPKFKSHQQLVATFAVKNMFGCVTGKQKAFWHYAKGKKEELFCEFLIDIYKFMKPVVTIIDGVVAMDGPGPISGRARPLGWLIGGVEPIACETICSELIGTAPENMPIITTAKKMGFGYSDLAKIKILGDDYTDHICTDFQFVKPIPIRFSLLRVCKSIYKQILLSIQSGKPGRG